MQTSIPKYIRQFLTYLEVTKNRSLATIQNYDFYLSRFAEWAEANSLTDISRLTLEDVMDYRLWLNRFKDKNGNDLKKNTQNYHLIALRAFLKYLAKIDVKVMAPEKIELAKMPERDVTFIEGSELERFLNAPIISGRNVRDGKEGPSAAQPEKERAEEKYNIIVLRDKAILETLFSTGLRVSELVGLKREQINLKRNEEVEELTVRGKGRKVRVVFLSNQAKYWIKKYFDLRRDTSPYLFISHDKARDKRSEEEMADKALTSRSVQRLVHKYAKIAGLTKKVSPHTLRHSFATNLLTNDADIRSVQTMLGHSSITTTQIYTHVTDKHLRETFVKHHRRK